ncbi:phosphonate ABC transporter, permease protein PhnE [Halorubrum terrestre]|uniref:Phosphonate ABC transporter inner membrane subunit n=2 Tax=Halorubrum distributum TaxID=29283 RepID=M0D8R3_9EURY|nr:phosphonate ABC transporter, permease protein PhnE [Halorubrum terrestre]ELZ31890.1 phosphonate ABC transporter inner membrane subunit [Halorubrum terrestre JCM 10247]MYL17965.1 phosphonate ABC transporter, permease protein PhnE [Halorubrum terrestre]
MSEVDAARSWRRFDRRRRIGRFVGVLAALSVFVASWRFLDMGITNVDTVPREIRDLLTRMSPPDLAYTPEIVNPLVETLHIAALGTLGALVLALPVALLAAENTTPNAATYWLGKLIVTVSRSVNTIIWALIFVVVFGSGPLAGAVAIAFRSVGFLGKLLGEEIEEIDFGQVEAVRAAGASPTQVLLYGIAPQVKPALVGLSVYRWDINVRDSTILGFVGAGGIGVQLFRAVNAFAWQSVSMILIVILGVVLASEALSASARRMTR